MTEATQQNSSEQKPPQFTAGDLKKLIGLTYRQLHDWEARAGVFDSQRTTEEGWRKFSTEEVLVLAVCAVLRRELSIPLEKLASLRGWLLSVPPDSPEARRAKHAKEYLAIAEKQDAELLSLRGEALKQALTSDANRFLIREYFQNKLDALRDCPIRYAYMCAQQGHTVYLYTNSRTSLILFEENLVKVIAARVPTGPTIICALNNTFNELRTALGKPVFERDGLGKPFLKKWQELQERPELTAAERKVVDLIRARAYQSVTVRVMGGQVLEAEQETEESVNEDGPTEREKQILQVLDCGDFETVTLKVHRGKVIRLNHKRPVKLNAATEKP